VPTYDITEDVPIDLAVTSTEATFELTDTAYDIVIDDLPFIVKVNNQDPYVRQTAPYKKDQFDNSQEPGEQSLTGWWLRSQTSWHNGAGISFYEPGTDYQHVSQVVMALQLPQTSTMVQHILKDITVQHTHSYL